MSGSIYGNIIKMSTWGESHGAALGVVVDGFPAGVGVDEADIQAFLDRRRPGQSAATTSRAEADEVEILSGVFEGRTEGTPISMLVKNTSQRSSDYDKLKGVYRPGHADYGYDMKYGLRDHRGGGRSSGRETIGRVAAGALCVKLLNEMGITCEAYASSIGSVHVTGDIDDLDMALRTRTATAMPDEEADRRAMELIAKCREELDSVGGTVTCVIKNVPAGVGNPVFDKLDARLAAAVMSVGAVKAVEIGDGVRVSESLGSYNNDPFEPGIDGLPAQKRTNHSGGILGGMSDGSPIVLKAHIKPTPSIAREQETVDNSGRGTTLSIHGRHDPVIVPRAAVVIECMCAFTVLDEMLSNMTARADRIKAFYGRD